MEETKESPSSINIIVDDIGEPTEDPELTSNDTEKTNAPDENYHIIDSRIIRKLIIEKKLYPTYENEIDDGLLWRNRWSKMASCFFTVTFIVMAASTIISFSAPQFPDIHIISYLAGCFGVVALMCDRFAHFCSMQSSNNTKRVNMLMKSIGINDTIPDAETVSGKSNIDDLKNVINENINKKK